MRSTLSHFLPYSHSLWCHQEGAWPQQWELIVQWAAVMGTSCCHHSKNSRVSSDHQMSRGTPGPSAVRKIGICIWIFLLSVHGLGFVAICLLWLYRVRDEDETCFAAWKLNSPYLCLASQFSVFPAVRHHPVCCSPWPLAYWDISKPGNTHFFWRRALSEYAFKVF